VINRGPDGTAEGTLYEDAGHGYGFYKNQMRRIRYRATTEGDSVYLRVSGLDGGEPIPRRKVLIRVLTPTGEVTGEGSERGTIRIALPAETP
jgi:alpha-glucosidase